MREIKFKGKGIASNEWYYGDLIIANDNEKSRHYYIIADEYSDKDGNIPNAIKLDTCNSAEVDKETAGQYTGLKDKNGKEIYEGDIVSDGNDVGKVVFDEHYLGFFVNFTEQEPLYDTYCLEVIGNTTDNPELLEEE